VVNPVLTSQGWGFDGYPGADVDPLHGVKHLHELYTRADDDYTGRATVPVLWDEATDTMVSNESSDILRIFNTAFADLVPDTPELYPADLAAQIDALNANPEKRFSGPFRHLGSKG
jgi:glutathionyl-hydroquinone reductase